MIRSFYLNKLLGKNELSHVCLVRLSQNGNRKKRNEMKACQPIDSVLVDHAISPASNS